MPSRNLVAVLVLILAPPLAVAQEAPKYGHEFHHDFRGKPLPAELELFGKDVDQYAKQEPAGLRITLPKDRDNLQPVGVMTTFPLRGDFEITFAVEILKAEAPKEGSFGVGSTFYVNRTAAPADGSTFGRVQRAGGNEVIVWDRSPGKESKFEGGRAPCTEKIVRLRLKRIGATWTYQWAPGMSDDFIDVNSWDFASDELKQVKLRCSSGGQNCAVEVRFLDLRVRSDGKRAGAPPAVAPGNPALPKDAPPAPGSKVWLLAAVGTGIVLIVIVALVVGIWFVFRRRGEPAAASKEANK